MNTQHQPNATPDNEETRPLEANPEHAKVGAFVAKAWRTNRIISRNALPTRATPTNMPKPPSVWPMCPKSWTS